MSLPRLTPEVRNLVIDQANDGSGYLQRVYNEMKETNPELRGVIDWVADEHPVAADTIRGLTVLIAELISAQSEVAYCDRYFLREKHKPFTFSDE